MKIRSGFFIFLLILSSFLILAGIYLTYHGYTLLLPSIITAIPLTIMLLISSVFFIFKKYRNVARKIISSIVVVYFCMAILFIFSWNIRRFAFSQIAINSNKLISAIYNYENENGNFPSSLNELVPNFLPKIPSTGMKRYPDYKYSISNKGWSLVIEAPLGVLNWDIFVYFSDQDYPEWMAGGSVERIGNWAYVHE